MAGFRPFRRKRRADDGKFLPKDVRAWRALLHAARYTARAPLAPTDRLDVAVIRAKKAVLPHGERHRSSPFLRLIVLAGRFHTLADAERQTRAGELALLCDACEPALVADPAPRPPRADIFG